MKQGTRGEASVHVDAAPEEAYDLLSDVTRMGEWSPECVGGEWRGGATGPVVGARFRGRNRAGRVRWSTTPTVLAAERGREFSFVVPNLLGRPMTKWTYRFTPDGGGTTVTESFELLKTQPAIYAVAERYLLGVADRKADLEQNMRRTLENVKRVLEATASDTGR